MTGQQWAQETAEKILKKEKKVVARNRGIIPYTTKDGHFINMAEKDISWWTNGFWGGILWQLYHATGDSLYEEEARNSEELLDALFIQDGALDHDNGFRWLPTAVADYRLTGSGASKNRGLLAASNLAGRFNPMGKFIRAWNDEGDGSRAGRAIIDCMMNLPLLYWAYEEIKDPRFLQIASMHADTAERYFIRPDGSVSHIVDFNPVTGEFLQSVGGQGYAEGSSWTRGQAWALYGFYISYRHTGNERYLNTAKRVADYFIANIPESNLIPVDFRQPADCSLEDSTAAAVAACGLLEISECVGKNERYLYHDAAVRLLKTLEEKRCNWDENCDQLVEKCTAAFHDKEHEFTIIYGDYFFIEAVWKLIGKDINIW